MKFLENYAADEPETFFQSLLSRFQRAIAKIFSSDVPNIIDAPPPPPAITRNHPAGKQPTVESLFGESGGKESGEILTTVLVGGRETKLLISRDAQGKVEIRQPSEMIRRSKPNGVSASTGSGAAGVTNVAGRVSQDLNSFGAALEPFVVFSKNSYWAKYALADNISLADLRHVPLDRIGELLAVVSPEVSNGLYIRTIFSNSGYEIEALKMDKDEKDERAQKELDAMRDLTTRQNGTEDVFFNRLFNTYFMRGSILAELVLDDNARDFVGIVTPDPSSLQFRRVRHAKLGTKWDFGQMQNGQFISLDLETVSYVPLNPFTDSIEGQPLISSSFFIAVFMMAVLRDFKRVIQQQGYPRYDIELDLAQLQNLMPSEAKTETPEGEQALQVWAETLKATVASYVKDLEPDETFLHFTGVKVNQPIGALGTNSLTSIDGLFKGLERMASRALKVPPLFMGITDAVSEANANRQFEAFLKDIENGQHAIENGIGRLYNLGLQAKGILARVRIRFAQMRSSERLRDAQADMTEATLASFQYLQGWISQDEAAKRGAKVEKSDVPEPRQIAAPTGDPAPPALDNGVNRLLKGYTDKLRVPTLGDLQKAKEIFQEYAPDDATDLIFADKAEN
jgi:hypothetical protein